MMDWGDTPRNDQRGVSPPQEKKQAKQSSTDQNYIIFEGAVCQHDDKQPQKRRTANGSKMGKLPTLMKINGGVSPTRPRSKTLGKAQEQKQQELDVSPCFVAAKATTKQGKQSRTTA